MIFFSFLSGGGHCVSAQIALFPSLLQWAHEISCRGLIRKERGKVKQNRETQVTPLSNHRSTDAAVFVAGSPASSDGSASPNEYFTCLRLQSCLRFEGAGVWRKGLFETCHFELRRRVPWSWPPRPCPAASQIWFQSASPGARAESAQVAPL